MFKDLTLKIYTFLKVRDSLVLFIIGLALLTTGMHEISLSQGGGLNIPRGAPPLDERPSIGAPGLQQDFSVGAPAANHSIGSGTNAATAQLTPFIQGRPSIFIQGRPDLFLPGLGAEEARNVGFTEDLLENRFEDLLDNTFDPLIDGTNEDLLANRFDPLIDGRNDRFIEGRPGELINGTPDRFIDGRLADSSANVGAEDLLVNRFGDDLDADGLAEQPDNGATFVAQQADIPFDDDLIRFSVGNLFKFIEGAFGALLVVGAGIGAIIAATVGAYKMALGLLVTSVGAFILRAYVSLFFGTDYPDFDSVNLADF